MKLKFLSLFVLMSMVQLGFAQRTITGSVADAETQEPLIGANVIIASSGTGTATDFNGEFSLEVPDEVTTLTISYTGYADQEVSIQGISNITVALSAGELLEEVIVTGYQTIKKKDLIGAVSVVKMEDAKEESNSNVLSSIQGRAAGVQISGDGQPGGFNTFINIRGFSTINDNNPLFVIDGVPTTHFNINSLNPNDIESLQILKDAASASIYGSRASNGVVVITTKGGAVKKPTISFDSYAGYQMIRNSLSQLNAQEWGQVYWQAKNGAGDVPRHPQYGDWESPIVPSFIDGNRTIPAASTDWVKESFDPAVQQSYSLSFANGNENGNIYMSANYLNQEGIMLHTGFDKYTLRLNSSYNVANRVTIGENLNVSYRNQKGLRDRGFTHTILFQHPLVPVYDSNGGWGGPTDGVGDKPNPVRVLTNAKDNTRKSWQVFGNVYADVKIIEGLNFKTNFGIDYINFFQKDFEPKWSEGTRSININFLNQEFKEDVTWNWTNTLSYVRELGDHSINALAGVEAIKAFGTGFNARRSDFLVETNDFRFLNAGTGEQTNGGFGVGSSLFSYFGKINYGFQSKYLFSATVRYDGSSRLGLNNRTDIFPAFSAAWRLSEEPFFDNVSGLSNLKVRAGYGKTGNQSINPTAPYTFFQSNIETGQYNLAGDNTSPAAGYILARNGNPDLLWETSTQTNFGVDVGFWDDRLEFSADYFIKDTDGMLVDPPLLATQGEGAAPVINAGKMQNKGFEFMLNYKSPLRNKFRYKVGLNLSAIRNEVIELGEGTDFFVLAEGARITPGYPVMSFYGHVADGLFQTTEEIANHAVQSGIEANAQSLGHIKYKDLNSDGVIDENDRTFIGNPHPDFTYGISLGAEWGGLDFNAFFQGVQGRDIFNTHKRLTDFTFWLFNYGQNTLDAWTPENPNTDIPAVSTADFNNEHRISSYFIEDGSYLKLKTVSLGYTLPKRWLKGVSSSDVRFYLQAQNLFVLTKYGGNDVEVAAENARFMGVDLQFYPHSRNIVFGVNANF